MKVSRIAAILATTGSILAAGVSPSAASDSNTKVTLTHLRHSCSAPHTFKVRVLIQHLTKGGHYTLTAETTNEEDIQSYQFVAKSTTFSQKGLKFKMEPTALPKGKSTVYFVFDHNRGHVATQLYGISPSSLPHCQ